MNTIFNHRPVVRRSVDFLLEDLLIDTDNNDNDLFLASSILACVSLTAKMRLEHERKEPYLVDQKHLGV